MTPARRTLAAACWASLFVAVFGGCDMLDMYDQPRYDPLEPSRFFANGMSARPAVDGTIARGQLREDVILYMGQDNGQPTPGIPDAALKRFYQRDHGQLKLPDALPSDVQLRRLFLERGRQRFEIYCAACHGRSGDGGGIIVERGFRRPPSYGIERLRTAPSGHIFDVITNGFGAMPSFAARIDPIDRWAIVAYVRALQLSSDARLDDVPANPRSDLDRPAQAEAAHGSEAAR